VTSPALSAQTVVMVVAAYLFAALPHLATMPPWLVLLVVGTAAWRAAVAIRNLNRPGWIVRSAATFGGLGLVIAHFGTLWGRKAATVLLCVMIAAKLSEMFRLRDARVVAALGYFLIATQFLFSQDVLMFGYLVVGCWLVTAALVRIQRDEDGPAPAVRTPVANPAALKSGLLLLVLAAPFALAMFMLFPRLASPLWGMPEEALDARTGLSDRMSPGAIADLYSDDSPAFRIEFDGPRPARRQLYWRGPVLWRFDGRTWTRLPYDDRGPPRRPGPGAGASSYRVQLEPSERRWMFALDYPVRAPAGARLTADFELIAEQPITSLAAYNVISQPDFVDSPSLDGIRRRLALHLPEGSNPRTRARAAELRERYPEDRQLVDAVLEWFNESNFSYSLDAPPLGRHGADEFLFDLRVGYCEYYASAFAVLMRAAGIPTRIVTGYQGGLWQSADEYLLVRQSDAHAWAEVWLQGSGWTRVDPTAAVSPERVMQSARSALGDTRGWIGAEWFYALRNQYDRLHRLWNDWVLAFDHERQEGLLARIGMGDLGPGLRALALVAIALLAILPLALMLQLLAGTARERDRLARGWARVRKRLARRGVSIQPGETPLELARRASPRLANGARLELLAERYARLRYGPETRARDRDELARNLAAWRPVPLN